MTFIDTPGFGTDMKRVLSQCLQAATSEGATTSGVIYLHRITDPDAESSSRAKLDMFRKLCGKKFQNAILCTTMWEKLGVVEGAVRERLLRGDSTLWGDMFGEGEGALVRRHQGGPDSSESARGIAEALVKRLAALQTRVESGDKVPLGTFEGKLRIGGVGREEVKREHTGEIEKLMAELRAASTAKDEAVALMEEMKQNHTEEVERLKAELQQATGATKDEVLTPMEKTKGKNTDEMEQPRAEERAASSAEDEGPALKEEMKGKHKGKEHIEEVRLLETTDSPPPAQSRVHLYLGGIVLVCLIALGYRHDRLPGFRKKSENK